MNISENKIVYAYSDGSSIGNPGPGGYGVVLKFSDSVKELSKGFVKTTNNRMELLGAIIALETLKGNQKVILSTDSQYVINGIEKGWAKKWRDNGWMRNKKDKALNPDMWSRLLDVVDQHDVKFIWVKGHSGHEENEKCDQLANQAAKSDDLYIDEGFIEE